MSLNLIGIKLIIAFWYIAITDQLVESEENYRILKGEVLCVDYRQNLQYIPNSATIQLFLPAKANSQNDRGHQLVAETVSDLVGTFVLALPHGLAIHSCPSPLLVVSSPCHHVSYYGSWHRQRTKLGCRFVYKNKPKLDEFLRIKIDLNEAPVECNWWRNHLKIKWREWNNGEMEECHSSTLATTSSPLMEEPTIKTTTSSTVATTLPITTTVTTTIEATTTVATTIATTTESTTTTTTPTTVTISTTTEVPTMTNNTCVPSSGQSAPLDVVLLLDGSGSISGSEFYYRVLAFARQLARSLQISPEGNHLAIVQFSGWPKTEFGLNEASSSKQIEDGLGRIRQMDTGTEIGAALYYTKNNVLNEARPDSDKIIVVVTDGESQDDVRMPALILLDQGVKIMAIGVGKNIVHDQLETLTGDPNRVYTVDTFDKLNAALVTQELGVEQC